MKALVYTGKEQLEFCDQPMPEPTQNEALLKIEYVGICGSDMHAFLGHDERRPAPLILGHEASGVIVEGEGKGKRVTVNPLVACGKCRACERGEDNLCPKREIISMPPRQGAFAQFLSMPLQNLIEIPNHVPFERAALCEPIACGWHAARKCKHYLGERAASSKALVIGGGAIGVGAALSLKAQGVEDVILIEPNLERRTLIEKTIGLEAISPEEAGDDAIFDIVIDGVGYEATRAQASKLASPGGVIAHIGLGSSEGGLDIRRMTLQEITFIGTYTYTAQDFIATADAIAEGKLGSLEWIEIRPLEEGMQAFLDIRSGKAAHPKIILKP